MMTKEQVQAQLRLFKSYTLLDDIAFVDGSVGYESGLIFSDKVTLTVLEEAKEMYGLTPEKWNQTFHKSFKTVLECPIEKLIAQQVLHYFTTYGFEALGIYDSELVYIPHEQLELPEVILEDIPMVIIRHTTPQELTESLMTLLTSNIALSKQTVSDIMTLSDYIDKNRFDEINNKEVKTSLYDKYGITPKNANEFLRYIIFKSTGSTLLIKNKDLIYKIKNSDTNLAYQYFSNYVSRSGGYVRLAEIFYRYQHLFLAYKRSEDTAYAKELNKIINKVGKLSKKYNKPVGTKILDKLSTIGTQTFYNEQKDKIIKYAQEAPSFRLVRIINGLQYRLTNPDDMLYTVRNGKAFVTKLEKHSTATKLAAQQKIIDDIKQILVNRLAQKLNGKTIYIPDNLNYIVPSTEKQFMGNIPEGSYIEVPRYGNMVVGINWKNLPSERVDLDLHMMNKNEHFGWNSAYRSSTGDLAFSGDITDAKGKDGATEVFLIKSTCENKSFLLTVNDFTNNRAEIPFKFLIGEFDSSYIDTSCVVDPNKIKAVVDQKFEYEDGYRKSNQKTLGLVEIRNNAIRIYFKEALLGASIATTRSEITKTAYGYLDKVGDTKLTLRELLESCGAKIVNTPTVETMVPVEVKDEEGNITETLYRKEEKVVDINLSLEAINKETLIKLLGE